MRRGHASVRAGPAAGGPTTPTTGIGLSFRRPDLSALRADDKWEEELLKKWTPRLMLARLKKAPGGTGMRTEHRRPFFELDLLTWATIAELVEHQIVPRPSSVMVAVQACGSM